MVGSDICDDPKQNLFIRCSYVYPSGQQCTNPVPKYLDPLLCGGHCDNIKPPSYDTKETVEMPAIAGSRKRLSKGESSSRKGKKNG